MHGKIRGVAFNVANKKDAVGTAIQEVPRQEEFSYFSLPWRQFNVQKMHPAHQEPGKVRTDNSALGM